MDFLMYFNPQKLSRLDFPVCPVVETLSSQCRRHEFDPWSGKSPHAARSGQTNKQKPSQVTARLRIANSPKIHSQGVRARTQPTFTATVRPCSHLCGLCQYPATTHRFHSSDLTYYRPFLRVHLTSCDKMLEVYLEAIPWIKIQGFGDVRTCAKLLCFLLGVLYF